MQVWIRSSYVNVFQDQRVSFNEATDERLLVMARNEYQSFQICLRSENSFKIKSVSFDDFSGAAGVFPADNFAYNYVEYVYCPHNTVNTRPQDVLRNAPDWFPDPLSNDRSVEVSGKQTQPIWITVFSPRGTRAGTYKGCVHVYTNQSTYHVPLSLEICAVTLPDTAQGTLDYMHHQQITGVWWLSSTPGYYPNDPITIHYGYNRWTAEWWKLVGDIAQQMRKHRQNILYLNLPQLLMDGGTQVDAAGKFTFDWSKVDQYVQFFMDAGVVKGLEGTHVASIDYYRMHFTTYLLHRNGEGVMEVAMAPYHTPESKNWLDQFLPALEAHVEEKGWLPIWYQHVGDEAMNDDQRIQYEFYFHYLRRLAPKLKVGDPVTHVDFARHQGNLGTDIQVPIESAFDENRELFADLAKRGVRIYLYNCCGPAESWLNRFIDKPVWQMRVLGWLLYAWDVKGFLHWGYNFWSDWNTEETLEISEEEVKGDHYTIYPDPHFAYKVRSSIRYEANRDAAQDYELLTILGRKDLERAKALVAAIARDAHTDYTHDTGLMLKMREALVREAALAAGEEA